MQITRQADYAVRAVLYLSGLDNGRRAPTSEIAQEQHIPPSFLAKIVSQLSVALQTKYHCLKWSKPLMARSC